VVRSLSLFLGGVFALLVAAMPAQAATTFVINPFAQAAAPRGVAVDPGSGDVYVADAGANEVLKVTPAGASTVIVSGLNAPSGVAYDASTGDLFIADTGNHEVKRLTNNGALTLVAGTGSAAVPTPGPATASALGGPSGLAVDSAGNLYIADGGGAAASANPYVEKVTPGGTLSILAGNGTRGQPVAGPATSSPLRTPTGVTIDAAGAVFIADAAANVVAKLTPAGALSTFAGKSTGAAGQPTTGTATNSKLNAPTGVATDAAGNLYIADAANNRVEEVTPADRLSVFAGIGISGAPSYGANAILSPLSGPAAVALTNAGVAYVANATRGTVDRIAPAPPTIAAIPAPTGTTTQGHTLTAVTGTWTNSPTAFTYEWQRCTPGCTDITGANGATYTLSAADAGGSVRDRVTAANAGGATTVASSTTAVVLPEPPAGTGLPGIAGTAVDVQTLAASPGTWTNSPTRFAYQWQGCDAAGAQCTAIAGATQSTYTLTLDNVAGTVRVVVTATNAGGSATATSVPTTVIQPALTPWANATPPGLLSAPTVSGSAAVGSTLNCQTGSWSNRPTGYEYQWNRGNAPIANASAATYTVTGADLGQALGCTVTAANAGGAIQADSNRVTIPRPAVCPAASGALSGAVLGPLQLGDTRSQARIILPHFQGGGRADSFCLAGGQGLRAVYASPTLVRAAIARADRAKVSGRVVLLLSANRRYAIHGVHPGARASAVKRAGRALRIGHATWYIIAGAHANGVIEIRSGRVVAVGIADTRLSSTRAAARRLLSGL
jgi:sugar lactone lactonase YvrE